MHTSCGVSVNKCAMDPSLWMEDLGDLGDLIQAVDQAEPGDRLDVDYDDDGDEFSGEEGEGFEDPDSFFHPIPHHEQLAGPQPSQNLPPTTQRKFSIHFYSKLRNQYIVTNNLFLCRS